MIGPQIFYGHFLTLNVVKNRVKDIMTQEMWFYMFMVDGFKCGEFYSDTGSTKFSYRDTRTSETQETVYGCEFYWTPINFVRFRVRYGVWLI